VSWHGCVAVFAEVHVFSENAFFYALALLVFIASWRPDLRGCRRLAQFLTRAVMAEPRLPPSPSHLRGENVGESSEEEVEREKRVRRSQRQRLERLQELKEEKQGLQIRLQQLQQRTQQLASSSASPFASLSPGCSSPGAAETEGLRGERDEEMEAERGGSGERRERGESGDRGERGERGESGEGEEKNAERSRKMEQLLKEQEEAEQKLLKVVKETEDLETKTLVEDATLDFSESPASAACAAASSVHRQREVSAAQLYLLMTNLNQYPQLDELFRSVTRSIFVGADVRLSPYDACELCDLLHRCMRPFESMKTLLYERRDETALSEFFTDNLEREGAFEDHRGHSGRAEAQTLNIPSEAAALSWEEEFKARQKRRRGQQKGEGDGEGRGETGRGMMGSLHGSEFDLSKEGEGECRGEGRLRALEGPGVGEGRGKAFFPQHQSETEQGEADLEAEVQSLTSSLSRSSVSSPSGTSLHSDSNASEVSSAVSSSPSSSLSSFLSSSVSSSVSSSLSSSLTSSLSSPAPFAFGGEQGERQRLQHPSSLPGLPSSSAAVSAGGLGKCSAPLSRQSFGERGTRASVQLREAFPPRGAGGDRGESEVSSASEKSSGTASAFGEAASDVSSFLSSSLASSSLSAATPRSPHPAFSPAGLGKGKVFGAVPPGLASGDRRHLEGERVEGEVRPAPAWGAREQEPGASVDVYVHPAGEAAVVDTNEVYIHPRMTAESEADGSHVDSEGFGDAEGSVLAADQGYGRGSGKTFCEDGQSRGESRLCSGRGKQLAPRRYVELGVARLEDERAARRADVLDLPSASQYGTCRARDFEYQRLRKSPAAPPLEALRETALIDSLLEDFVNAQVSLEAGAASADASLSLLSETAGETCEATDELDSRGRSSVAPESFAHAASVGPRYLKYVNLLVMLCVLCAYELTHRWWEDRKEAKRRRREEANRGVPTPGEEALPRDAWQFYDDEEEEGGAEEAEEEVEEEEEGEEEEEEVEEEEEGEEEHQHLRVESNSDVDAFAAGADAAPPAPSDELLWGVRTAGEAAHASSQKLRKSRQEALGESTFEAERRPVAREPEGREERQASGRWGMEDLFEEPEHHLPGKTVSLLTAFVLGAAHSGTSFRTPAAVYRHRNVEELCSPTMPRRAPLASAPPSPFFQATQTQTFSGFPEAPGRGKDMQFFASGRGKGAREGCLERSLASEKDAPSDEASDDNSESSDSNGSSYSSSSAGASSLSPPHPSSSSQSSCLSSSPSSSLSSSSLSSPTPSRSSVSGAGPRDRETQTARALPSQFSDDSQHTASPPGSSCSSSSSGSSSRSSSLNSSWNSSSSLSVPAPEGAGARAESASSSSVSASSPFPAKLGKKAKLSACSGGSRRTEKEVANSRVSVRKRRREETERRGGEGHREEAEMGDSGSEVKSTVTSKIYRNVHTRSKLGRGRHLSLLSADMIRTKFEEFCGAVERYKSIARNELVQIYRVCRDPKVSFHFKVFRFLSLVGTNLAASAVLKFLCLSLFPGQATSSVETPCLLSPFAVSHFSPSVAETLAERRTPTGAETQRRTAFFEEHEQGEETRHSADSLLLVSDGLLLLLKVIVDRHAQKRIPVIDLLGRVLIAGTRQERKSLALAQQHMERRTAVVRFLLYTCKFENEVIAVLSLFRRL
ncbi:putative transmembrane protein, partial [Toxoplasma gondii MAS]